MGAVWDRYGEWDKIAQLQDPEEVKALITGRRKAWRPNYIPPAVAYAFNYAADEQTASGTTPCAVDFGCGLGRNAPMLRQFFPRVVGVDLPEMVDRLKKEHPHTFRELYEQVYTSPQEASSREAFSVVYDSVVLQHVVDIPTVIDIVNSLSAVSSMRTFISLCNFSAVPPHFGILKDRGWVIWHTEDERMSFEGAMHTVTIFRRWSL